MATGMSFWGDASEAATTGAETVWGGVKAAASGAQELWKDITTPVAGQKGEVGGGVGPVEGSAGQNVDANGNPVGYQASGQAGPSDSGKGSASTDAKGVPVEATGSWSYGAKGNAGVGSFTDLEGKQSTGARAEATTGTKVEGAVNTPQGSVGAEAQGPSAWIGASDNGSTTEVGASAQAAAASVNAATKGTSHDESFKAGASAGPGLAGRFHHGDADGDQRTEWGFGFDYGPASVDVKTEDPLRTATKLNPFTMPLGIAADAYDFATGGDTNWTEKAGDAAKAFGAKASEVGSGAVDAAKKLLGGDTSGFNPSDLWQGMF